MNLNKVVITASFPLAIIDEAKPNTQANMSLELDDSYNEILFDLFEIESEYELIERITPAIIKYLDFTDDLEAIKNGDLPPKIEFNLGFAVGIACRE